jgi:hypothetical protein
MDDCKNDGMTTSEQYMVMVKENIRGPVKRTWQTKDNNDGCDDQDLPPLAILRWRKEQIEVAVAVIVL